MKFDFIPFRFNANIADFKDEILYIATDNGVDLYKSKDEVRVLIPGILFSVANLYFFEVCLITVYIHLTSKSGDFGAVSHILANTIKEAGKVIKSENLEITSWSNNSEYLGLVKAINSDKLYLYYTLHKYNIYGL